MVIKAAEHSIMVFQLDEHVEGSTNKVDQTTHSVVLTVVINSTVLAIDRSKKLVNDQLGDTTPTDDLIVIELVVLRISTVNGAVMVKIEDNEQIAIIIEPVVTELIAVMDKKMVLVDVDEIDFPKVTLEHIVIDPVVHAVVSEKELSREHVTLKMVVLVNI